MRAVALLMVLTTAAAARAGTDEELAKAHYLTGQSYFRQGRHREALQQFDEAYRISRRPALYYNMALCHEQLGQRSEAATAFERYLAADPTTADRVEIERRIVELRGPATTQPSASAHAIASAPPAVERAEKPLHKQGWFWAVVGGTTAVVVVAIVLGVTLGGGDAGPRTLEPVPLR